MKTILMLTVGLMLAGCGSTENHGRNHGFPQPPRDPLRVPVTVLRWTRYALALDDCTMALPQPNGPLHTHMYEVRPRKDKRGLHLISDALPFGRLWYDTPNNAIGYAMHRQPPFTSYCK